MKEQPSTCGVRTTTSSTIVSMFNSNERIGSIAIDLNIRVQDVEEAIYGKVKPRRIRPNPPYTPVVKVYKAVSQVTIDAVKHLTDNDIVYLNNYAKVLIRTIHRKGLEGLEGKDFVSDMLKRTLEGIRIWQYKKCTFEVFLKGGIRSLISSYNKHIVIDDRYMTRLYSNTELGSKDVPIADIYDVRYTQQYSRGDNMPIY